MFCRFQWLEIRVCIQCLRCVEEFGAYLVSIPMSKQNLTHPASEQEPVVLGLMNSISYFRGGVGGGGGSGVCLLCTLKTNMHMHVGPE